MSRPPDPTSERAALRHELGELRTRLREAEESLQAARRFEEIGRTASAIAHDFGNVMAVIAGCADLLLRRLDPAHPLRTQAESVKKATVWGLDLSRQLLGASRSEPSPRVTVDVNAVVLNLIHTLEPVLGDEIEVLRRLDPAAGRVRLGAGQLEQVLINLMLNARDAMAGRGRLIVETERTSGAPGAGVAIRVTDTGHGMDPATLSRVFEPYFTTKPVGQGTGLGLSTAFGLVTQAGGAMEARSDVGEGSTFTVWLPSEAPAPREGSVLVIEDEPGVREVISEILMTSGYDVLETRDLEEVTAVAGRQTIDVVIADLSVPGVREGALAAALRRTSSRPAVLYVTGDAEDAEPGGREVLVKPFTLDALLSKVRAARRPRAVND